MINGHDVDVTKALELDWVVRDPEASKSERSNAMTVLTHHALTLQPLLIAEVKRLRGSLSVGNHAWIALDRQEPRMPGDYACLIDGCIPVICSWMNGFDEPGVSHWCFLPSWPEELRLA